MALDESIVEDAALEWFRRRQGYAGQVRGFTFATSVAEVLEVRKATPDRAGLCGRARGRLRRATAGQASSRAHSPDYHASAANA